MNSIEILVLNFEEVRRRSIKIWTSIPDQYYTWKPDPDALNIIEMIHHVLASEYSYFQIILNRGSIKDFQSPFKNLSFNSVDTLLEFSSPFRNEFLKYIQSLNEEDLSSIMVDRTDLSELGYLGYIRSLGDFLLRIAYHEAVHTGQLLDYLRSAELDRKDIWD